MVVKGVYNHNSLYLQPYRVEGFVQEEMDNRIDYQNGDAVIIVARVNKRRWKGNREQFKFPEPPKSVSIGTGFFVGAW